MTPTHITMIEQELRGLIGRLSRVKPFALQETMLPAAAPSGAAISAVDQYLAGERRKLRLDARTFLRWLKFNSRTLSAAEAHQKFVYLRLSFNRVLSQFDLYSDAITQRSENDNGLWLAGLDALAEDSLNIGNAYVTPPPVICYLDRGIGAAIRRARTRLPGGGENPVGMIKIPRERMVGSSVASSLIHEVGHQGAALLSLVSSLKADFGKRQQTDAMNARLWSLWNRWISEIVADFWSVATVGITATLGLVGVVSLPPVFVFKVDTEDPHPPPWLRVKISAAIGNVLYPHSLWDEIRSLWAQLYPKSLGTDPNMDLLLRLEAHIPRLVETMTEHRSSSLHGKTLAQVLKKEERTPERLAILFERWSKEPELIRKAPISLAFAVFGQARIQGRISPEAEGRVLSNLLRYRALRRLYGADTN